MPRTSSPARAKRIDERGEVEVEDQLAVDGDERLVAAVGIEQRQRVLEAAAGAEDRRLVAVLDARAERLPSPSSRWIRSRAMMRVDDEVGDAVRDEVRDPVVRESGCRTRASSGLGHSAPSLPSRVESPAHSSIARIALTVAHGAKVLPYVLSSRGELGPLPASHVSPRPSWCSPMPVAFDRATDVADEKLFGPGPDAPPSQAFGAWEGNELVGVAAVAARWLRVLAVAPARA